MPEEGLSGEDGRDACQSCVRAPGTLVASEGFRAEWPHTENTDSGRGPFPQAARRAPRGRGKRGEGSSPLSARCSVFTSRNENETQEADLRSEGAACETPTQRSATFRVRQKGWSLPFEGGKGETQS